MDKLDKSQFKISKKFSIIVGSIIVAMVFVAFLLFVEIPISNVDTSNWKTYRNEEYGFEFKYPGDKKIIENVDNAEFGVKNFGVKIVSEGRGYGCWKKYIFMNKHLFNMYEVCDGMLPGSEILFVHLRNRDYEIFPMSTFDFEINRDILATFKFIN